MNTKRILEILKIILQCLETNEPVKLRWGLCELLRDLLILEIITPFEKDYIIQNLYNHLPNKFIRLNTYWWPTKEKEPRIEYIKTIIKLYEETENSGNIEDDTSIITNR